MHVNSFKRWHVQGTYSGDSTIVFDVKLTQGFILIGNTVKDALRLTGSRCSSLCRCVKPISASSLSPEGSLPISHVCKTSHACLLVSGELLSTVVVPVEACFSRLKDDDVCHCTLIEGGDNRLNPRL